MKRIFIITVLLSVVFLVRGQDYTYYTQYMFNGLSINPAYAGSNDFINISGDVREQWIGFEGAPSTQTISAHSPILNDQFGLGLQIVNDKVGISYKQEVSVSYSYKLRLPEFDLSMGLKMGFNSLSAHFNELNLDSELDMNFQDEKTKFSPIIGIGAYIKASNYYIGFSIPQLYKFVNTDFDKTTLVVQKLVFLNGGYLIPVNNEIKVKPSFLAKANFGSTFEFDFNANLYYKDFLGIGLSYRSLNSVSILFEIGFNKTCFFGYSYDMPTTRLIKYQGGTHEISFNIYLNRRNKSIVINPRYF